MRNVRPSLEALRTFVAVVEERSVSAAAKRLGVKQPVVSRKLRAFADASKCGAVLLERTLSGWKMSDAGEAVLTSIRELIRQYDQLFEYLKGTASAPVSVRVGLGNFAAHFYLPEAMAQLRDRLDECQLTAQIVRGRERILGVADGRFDLAIVSHDPAQVREILRAQGFGLPVHTKLLGRRPLVVIASRQSSDGKALARSSPDDIVPLERLREWELVGLDRESGLRKRLEKKLLRSGELRFVVEGGGWWSARGCVRQGLGVGIVPLSILSPADQEELVIRRLSERCAIEDYLIYKVSRGRGPQSDVAEALRQASKKHRACVRETWVALHRD